MLAAGPGVVGVEGEAAPKDVRLCTSVGLSRLSESSVGSSVDLAGVHADGRGICC